uniref:Uncharacterized protein n=1 Tax=Zea mays TaxID=4577 RepID=C0PHN4_MAIZE|nr:unknown [Zea mays]
MRCRLMLPPPPPDDDVSQLLAVLRSMTPRRASWTDAMHSCLRCEAARSPPSSSSSSSSSSSPSPPPPPPPRWTSALLSAVMRSKLRTRPPSVVISARRARIWRAASARTMSGMRSGRSSQQSDARTTSRPAPSAPASTHSSSASVGSSCACACACVRPAPSSSASASASVAAIIAEVWRFSSFTWSSTSASSDALSVCTNACARIIQGHIESHECVDRFQRSASCVNIISRRERASMHDDYSLA